MRFEAPRVMFVLQTAHGEVISRRQSVERMTELQQSKYQDLQAGLPSELSMQLAEVALALGSAEDQVISIDYTLSNVVLNGWRKSFVNNFFLMYLLYSLHLLQCSEMCLFFLSSLGPSEGKGGSAN